MIDHLRVSNVQIPEENNEQTKFVEIAMAVDHSDNEANDDNDAEESEADFYRPVGLSPMKRLGDF